jgi:hypothetical protein
VWAIPPRPGANVFRKVLAIGATELVLAEQDAQPLSVQADFKRLVRLSVSQLDSIVASW